jgi:hypothetical protein
MTLWFAFKNDGHVYELNGIAEKELAATFAHGYPTEAKALANPNDPANAAQVTLLASFLASRSAGQGGTSGVLTIDNVNAHGQSIGHQGPGNNPVTNAVKKITDPLQAIGDFFSKLGQANLWIRVGEVILGVILLAVGAARITHTENLISKAVGHTPAGRAAKLI